MNENLILLITLNYSIIETLEKFGVKKKYAHLLAVPVGILLSFLILEIFTTKEAIIYGILSGLSSVGVCDASCSVVDSAKEIIVKKKYGFLSSNKGE